MSGGSIVSCQTPVSTIFVFESPGYQRACNTVYAYVSTMDSQTTVNAVKGVNSSGNTNYIRFKSDLERMQYILGLYGNSNATSKGNTY
jgi:hypothetical protein